jgi:hypothetical protein
MDLAYFVRERTALIRHFYDAASAPFIETRRLIEAVEPPFHDPPGGVHGAGATILSNSEPRRHETRFLRLQEEMSAKCTAAGDPRRVSAGFKTFGAGVHGLPALLPEVWLHWDPKTINQRGALAFPNHRMDFLMLLPGGRRFVFEIDGKQHYAVGERAEPREFAKLAAGTRDMQLAGYEVYRFGGSELVGEPGQALVAAFFKTLFEVHRVSAAG